MPQWRSVRVDGIRGRLLGLLERLASARVVVVGDIAADVYISGLSERVSREAPVLIVRYERQWLRPGCAANVARNLARLGAAVHLIGWVGSDEFGRQVLESLADEGVDVQGVIVAPDQQTATKTRFLAGARHTMRQQVLRLDRLPERPLSAGIRSLLVERTERLADQAGAWIASDYGAGTIDATLRHRLRQLAGAGRTVLADSRYNILEFEGVTAVKPNEEEAAAAIGMSLDSLDDTAVAAQRLRERLAVRAAVVTLGNRGMMLADGDGSIWHVPPAGGDEIVDLTGAGDTAAAVLAAALAAGGSFLEAACLANAAGSVVVMRHGAAAASVEEIARSVEDWSE